MTAGSTSIERPASGARTSIVTVTLRTRVRRIRSVASPRWVHAASGRALQVLVQAESDGHGPVARREPDGHRERDAAPGHPQQRNPTILQVSG